MTADGYRYEYQSGSKGWHPGRERRYRNRYSNEIGRESPFSPRENFRPLVEYSCWLEGGNATHERAISEKRGWAGDTTGSTRLAFHIKSAESTVYEDRSTYGRPANSDNSGNQPHLTLYIKGGNPSSVDA